MNRRMKTVRATLVAVAIICLIFTIGSTYARFSGVRTSNLMTESIMKIKTVIASYPKK